MKNKKAIVLAKAQWFIIAIIALLLLGMFVQKVYPLFSTISYGSTCENWMSRNGIDPTSIAPFVWGGNCVTSIFYDSGLRGCQITYQAGSCPSGGCTPTCTGKSCGDDGCGGTCGTCAASFTCYNGQCVESCSPGQSVCLSSTTYKNCLPNGEFSGILNCVAGTTCSNGVCISQPTCTTPGDDDCNNIISDSEILNMINKWINGQTTRIKLGQAFQAWSNS